MSHTWQTMLYVGSGAILGVLGMWFAGRKPRWRRIMDVSFALAILGVAVLIALGHFDRLDAIWPAVVAGDVLAHGFFGRERKALAAKSVSAELEPGRITFSRNMPPLTKAEADELKAKWRALYGKPDAAADPPAAGN